MSHHLLLVIHLLAATVWVGGHLYLVCCILPQVLRQKDTQRLLRFEKTFEPLGVPSLIVLVITGIWMAHQFGVKISDWFSFSSGIEKVVSLKLILLFSTVLLALSAQFRVIPSLRSSSKKLLEMAIHAISVTLLGIALLTLGSFIRYGGL